MLATMCGAKSLSFPHVSLIQPVCACCRAGRSVLVGALFVHQTLCDTLSQQAGLQCTVSVMVCHCVSAYLENLVCVCACVRVFQRERERERERERYQPGRVASFKLIGLCVCACVCAFVLTFMLMHSTRDTSCPEQGQRYRWTPVFI